MPGPNPPDFSEILRTVADGGFLEKKQSERAFEIIMNGEAGDIPLSAFLTALHVRGETSAELQGAVQAVRSRMTSLPHVPEHCIDVCGTGGDGLGTLNVSTAVAFVLAGLDVPVAKHGNRALSSHSGATDVLEKIGIPVCEDILWQSRALNDHSLAFLAAPVHHPAMRHAAGVRKTLGFRTIFNLLGPLCNPARVSRQLVGVFDARWCRPVAETLGQLGATSVWVVHGNTDAGGSDELTLAGPARVTAWEQGRLLDLMVEPTMVGFEKQPISSIRGGDPGHNAEKLLALLAGERSVYRDTVLLNAAVALHVAGRGNIVVDDNIDSKALKENLAMAASSLDEGRALDKFRRIKSHAAKQPKILEEHQKT